MILEEDTVVVLGGEGVLMVLWEREQSYWKGTTGGIRRGGVVMVLRGY